MKRDLIFLMSKMVAIAVQFLGQGHFNLNECVCVCVGGGLSAHTCNCCEILSTSQRSRVSIHERNVELFQF